MPIVDWTVPRHFGTATLRQRPTATPTCAFPNNRGQAMSKAESETGTWTKHSVDSPRVSDDLNGRNDGHDAVHRSHHVDSGLDVSEDANEDVTHRLEDGQTKPSVPLASVPISISPPRSPHTEYIYADSQLAHRTSDSTSPKPYVKPTVISASVSLPVPGLTINTDLASHGAAAGAESAKSHSQSETQLETPSQPDSAPPKTPVAPEPAKIHKQAKSVGPSMLEQVISKTRPTHLPPKNKLEDVKHMKDWEEMMEKSRMAERQKKQEMEQRRLARERAVEDSILIWKREIVPNWREAVRKPHLRAMWWRGIPTKLRGQMWIAAVGNGMAISKDTYKRCLARARRAITSGSFPVETMAIIEEDIRGTLPALHIFHPETGPLYPDLKDLLCAWVVSRSDEGLGYVRGVSNVAGMFLLNMSPDEAFICIRNLLERHCLRSFYGGPSTRDDIEAYYRIFDTLLADGLPKGKRTLVSLATANCFIVFFNFKQHQITPSQYLPDWILPMFLQHLPFEACARIWDVIVLEGDSFLYRAALAIIAVIEPRLFFPDRKELMEVLRGENKAALEVAKRSGIRIDATARYEQYGMNEEVLWEQIESMEEWWKDSTWGRLIQRELPDV
ncbi:TBC1 domain family member 14 [Ceratobasidium theobromae]|uniref:TBC1 domain family member 14 n=1 Tax=Ceratobasidium theobromae TaxID=1582974 RepID=A0A5N5QNE1_9AGAM|nr:TBC1 domain family member 14 [Ceratobasidium theobromae]